MIDEEYWNHSREEINAISSDDSDAESGNLFLQNCCQRNLIKDIPDPLNIKKMIVGCISS